MAMTEPITRAIDKEDKRINTSNICNRRLKRGRESTPGQSVSIADLFWHTVFFELFIDLASVSRRFVIIIFNLLKMLIITDFREESLASFFCLCYQLPVIFPKSVIISISPITYISFW